MKSSAIKIFLTYLSISCLILTACKPEDKEGARQIDENTTVTPAPEPESLDISKVSFLEAEEFDKLSHKGRAVLIDVRLPGEFNQGHIEGAQNINFFDPGFKQTLLDLDRDKKYYLYCKNGNRSQMAAAFMNFNDFENVYVLKGGYEEWKKNSLK